MDDTSSSRSSPTPSERRLAIARILGPKGLRGGVRVELLTDWPEHLAVGEAIWLDGDGEPVGVAKLETGGRVPVLYLEGIDTREAAERLNGRFLEAVAKPLPEGSYYWSDLVGLRVENAGGAPIGELVEIFRAGGNEVYRVIGPGGERLVPALRSAVLRIDLDAGVMVVAADDAEEVG
jgi:16S rRNA processing protein RimM